MTSEPGRRKRGAETTVAILDVTVELLTETGYGNLTIDAVAERAGASKATIYRRWSSKSDLVVAAISTVIVPVDVADQGDFVTEFRSYLIDRFAIYGNESGRRLVAALIGAAPTDLELGEALRTWLAGTRRSTIALLERGRARGDVRTDVDLASIVTLVSAPLLHRGVVEQSLPDLALVDDIVTLVAAAVAPPP